MHSVEIQVDADLPFSPGVDAGSDPKNFRERATSVTNRSNYDYTRHRGNSRTDRNNLIFDPEFGFSSRDGAHVDRGFVIQTAKSMLKSHLEQLFLLGDKKNNESGNNRVNRPVACINLHIQSNVGDSALMEAQLQVIRDLGIPLSMLVVNTTGPARTPAPDATTAKLLVEEIDAKRGTVLIAAGGNMGTIYKMNQDYYNNVIQLVPNARVIHLPQSLVVDERLIKHFNRTVGEIYRSHPDVHVLMRDRSSYQMAKILRMTPEGSGRTVLVPDLAFYLGDLSGLLHDRPPIKPLAWMKRADGEETATQEGEKNPGDIMADPRNKDVFGPMDWRGRYCPEHGEFRESANTKFQKMETKEKYYDAELKRGTRLLGQGSVVLTDRLHGQILSYLAGFPLVVLKDKTWKGRHFYETWTHVSKQDTRLVTDTNMVTALEEARTMIPETFVYPATSTPANTPPTTIATTATPISLDASAAVTNVMLVPDRVTLVCLTADPKRWPDLKNILHTATDHAFIYRVVIIWNNPTDIAGSKKIEASVAQMKSRPTMTKYNKIHLMYGPVNTLNNRYDPSLLKIKTEAVMIIDDDIFVTPDTIPCLFESWQQDKSKIHAFGDARKITDTIYDAAGFVANKKELNFLLPRMMFHTKYLDVYFSDENTQIRQYVDTQEAHCDDIAFASVISKSYGGALVHVPAPHAERHSGGDMAWFNTRNNEEKTIDTGLLVTTRISTPFEHRKIIRLECARSIFHMLNWTLPKLQKSTCAYAKQFADNPVTRGWT